MGGSIVILLQVFHSVLIKEKRKKERNTCNVYPGSHWNDKTSFTIYLSPDLIPLLGITGSGQAARPTAEESKHKKIDKWTTALHWYFLLWQNLSTAFFIFFLNRTLIKNVFQDKSEILFKTDCFRTALQNTNGITEVQRLYNVTVPISMSCCYYVLCLQLAW